MNVTSIKDDVEKALDLTVSAIRASDDVNEFAELMYIQKNLTNALQSVEYLIEENKSKSIDYSIDL